MTPFDFYPRTRIVFGPGKVAALGELAGELGARRVLVVSDPGIVQAGHTARGIQMLEQAGIETQLFGEVGENPTTDHVAAGLKIAKRFEPELIVGLGGGSSMDCAKGINFVYTNGGQIQDYWGIGKATQPMLPMIAVPTTAGTGSETQSFALISDAKTPCENGVRRQESQLPRGAVGSGIDAYATTAGDGANRHRRRRPCAGKLCVPHAKSGFDGVQPRGLAGARRQLCPCAGRSDEFGGPQRHAIGRQLLGSGD